MFIIMFFIDFLSYSSGPVFKNNFSFNTGMFVVMNKNYPLCFSWMPPPLLVTRPSGIMGKLDVYKKHVIK